MNKQPNFENQNPENTKDTRTHYEVLGVAENATEAQINQALRDISQKFHPDVNSDPAAAEEMKRISEARAELTNKDKRESYDLRNGLGSYRKYAKQPEPQTKQETQPPRNHQKESAVEFGKAVDGVKGRLKVMTKYEHFSLHLPLGFKDDKVAMARLKQWSKDFTEGLKRIDFDYVAADAALDEIIEYPPKTPATPTTPQTPPAPENPQTPPVPPAPEPVVPPAPTPEPVITPEPVKDPVVTPNATPVADPVVKPVKDPVNEPVKDLVAPAAQPQNQPGKTQAEIDAEAALNTKNKAKINPTIHNTVYNIPDWKNFNAADKKGYFEQTLFRLQERVKILSQDKVKNAALIDAFNLFLFDFGGDYNKPDFDAVASQAAFEKLMADSNPAKVPGTEKVAVNKKPSAESKAVYNVKKWKKFKPAEKQGYYDQILSRLQERVQILSRDKVRNAALIEAFNLWLFEFGNAYNKPDFNAVASQAAFDKLMADSGPDNIPDADKVPQHVAYNADGFAIINNPGAEPITTTFRLLEEAGTHLIGKDEAGKLFLVDRLTGTALSLGYSAINKLGESLVATDRTGFRRLLSPSTGKAIGSFYSNILERDGLLIACEGGKFEKVLDRETGATLSRPFIKIFMKDGKYYGTGVTRDELIELD